MAEFLNQLSDDQSKLLLRQAVRFGFAPVPEPFTSANVDGAEEDVESEGASEAESVFESKRSRVMFVANGKESNEDGQHLLSHDGDNDDGDIDMAAKEKESESRRARVTYRIALAVVCGLLLACIIVLVLSSPDCGLSTSEEDSLAWWKRAVIYQIYPRSLQDSNDDGVGDLAGVTSRLDYLSGLGVSTLWLSPVFTSPMVDFGYDISNYTDVDPVFGRLSDLRVLLDAVHDRGMHLLLDYVPNHTSDKHKWFKESRSSKENPKRDWYVWADAKDGGGLPNNWLSVFGGSAWQWDNLTQQYYLHQFTIQQPDLNYRNADVQKAMIDVLRFWLRFGVDGFRLDAIAFLFEDPSLTNETCLVDGSPSEDCTDYSTMIHSKTQLQPGLHGVVRSWRKVLDDFGTDATPRFMVGEIYTDNLSDIMTLYGTPSEPECHFPFNFLLLELKQWTGVALNATISKWLNAMPADSWPNWVIGNHDNSRVATRLGRAYARAANLLLLTLPGTPTSYYGEEIGMEDGVVLWNETRDPFALNTNDISNSRDPERTPMQWNCSVNAGFTSPAATPWLPVAGNYLDVNVEKQEGNSSMLALYRSLLALRNRYAAFQHGSYESVLATADVLTFLREYKPTNSSIAQFLVAINVGMTPSTIDLHRLLPQYKPTGHLELSTSERPPFSAIFLSSLELSVGEGIVVRLQQSN